ncbi:rab family [Anaeramoeba ignava]|uniref:Ras-related protein Rab-7b n=1 Tax=Anaeramoeba ignava TaxID=1746090 RepID=A0A9Q0LXC0_ANAIG|nr:rab family [Anaeramoeba ignava]
MDPSIKIILLGDMGVGKTSLIHSYVLQTFQEEYKTTIGADFLNKKITIDENQIDLQIWDTAGQERFQSLNHSYYRGSDCCALVFDVTNRESFQNVSRWKEDFLQHSEPEDSESFPFVVIANKIDLTEQRVITEEEIKNWRLKNSNIPTFETSAKNFSNLDDLFLELTKKGLKRQSEISEQVIEFIVNNEDETTKEENQKKCC